MNRALPARIVDLIRDGVPAPDVRLRRDPAVFGALVSTAMSCQQRGHNWADLYAELYRPTSQLGRQSATTFRVWPGKARTAAASLKVLQKAWATAGEHLTELPPADGPSDIAGRLDEIEEAMRGQVGSANDRTIMAHALLIARDRGYLRIALPKHRIIDSTGICDTQVRKCLARLNRNGWLVLVERGRPGPNSGLASVYLLGTPPAGETY